MKKKLLAVVLAMAFAASLAACGGSDSPSASAASSSASAAQEIKIEGLKEAFAEQPILLTSVGQSADVEMVKVMIEKSELTYTMSTLATPDDLGENKTLLLAIGGSSKGLGAAGIDANQEIERVKSLITAADEKGMSIIAVHIGGEARRGDLSDKFIAPSFEKADYAVVVKDGDKDQMMSKLASDAGIPMEIVASMGEVVTPLKAAFK
ncbi:DUF6305 family protein [Oscillospiraceae bacterium LTW-04]|nr:DUF6305 family protein [Oscillospiraceae bacterium MB24-C1]